jgi:hypothetical protein
MSFKSPKIGLFRILEEFKKWNAYFSAESDLIKMNISASFTQNLHATTPS